MIKIFFKYFLLISLVTGLIQCKSDKEETMKNREKEPSTFAEDFTFLNKYSEVVVLGDEDGRAQVIVSPRLQGKVMTSTATGKNGRSFGWINYGLISSGKIEKHMNGYGGEDRLWLGPEGGQFSIFFAPGREMKIENWFTPKGIDTEPFQMLQKSKTEVEMQTSMLLQNYAKTTFDVQIKRKITLLSNEEIAGRLKIEAGSDINSVAFESENILINNGSKPWMAEGGTVCLWILGMFRPSDQVTIVVPFKNDKMQNSPVVTSDYFGEIPEDRLKIKDNWIFFKADGKYRSKIGVSPQRATQIAGSYDALNQVLTIIHFDLPEGDHRYLNQLWEIQKDPFKGDVINSYNDGPLADGTQMGPFYELESSSPAAFLKPGERMTHHHTTFHFVGPENQLDQIAKSVLGVDLKTITSVFK